MITKEGVSLNDLADMCPAIIYIISQCLLYAECYDFKLVFTSFISDRAEVDNKSESHSTGRAFDVRIWNIPELHRFRLCKRLNEVFKNIGAITLSGKTIVAVLKEDHMHIQVRTSAEIAQYALLL